MKKIIISGIVVIVLGLLIALGPQFLFKTCDHGENGYPHCHWSAQAEIGTGLLIVALGACMIVFTDPKTHLGLIIGVFMASLIAFAIPNFLIGGCGMLAMKCRKITFPALTAESVFLLVFSAIVMTVIVVKKPVEESSIIKELNKKIVQNPITINNGNQIREINRSTMLNNINEQNIHKEIGTDGPVGKEIW